MTTPNQCERLTVPIDDLTPNDWNPNKQTEFMYTKELDSIQRFGFVDPITVRATPGAATPYEIINGYHRWTAAKALGYTEVPIDNLGPLDRAAAMALTSILNELHGEPDKAILAANLKELSLDPALLDLLPYTEQQIVHMQAFAELPPMKLESSEPDEPDSEWIPLAFELKLKDIAYIQTTLQMAMEGRAALNDRERGVALLALAHEYRELSGN